MPEGSLVRLAGSERGSLPDITDTASVERIHLWSSRSPPATP